MAFNSKYFHSIFLVSPLEQCSVGKTITTTKQETELGDLGNLIMAYS